MPMLTLPSDIARCAGAGYQLEDGSIDWRDGCERCLRRLAKPGERAVWIEPPPVIVFECEWLIVETSDED